MNLYNSDEELIMIRERKHNPFKLDDEFIEGYENKNPKYGMDIVGLITFYRTYSRPIPELKRNEHWFETVRRVVEGTFDIQREYCMKHKRNWSEIKGQRLAQIMYDKIFNFKISPPGRGLFMMGTQFVMERGGSALNNCAYVSTENIDDPNVGAYPFAWAMDFLMVGAGVSSDTKGANKIIVRPSCSDKTHIYIIPDTREGWVNSVYLLISEYFIKDSIKYKFAYYKIRDRGLPIKGFGGISSGHEPLKEMHESIREILENRAGSLLTSVDITDIFNNIAKCVVAGNVRRSSMLMLGDPDDFEFFNAKNPIDHAEELASHRWASNNSLNVTAGKTNYNKFIGSICRNGEPGFVWLDHCKNYGRMGDPPNTADSDVGGVNPCGEIALASQELCNLVSIYPSHHDTYDEFEESLKFAYMYAKTVTLIETNWPETNEIIQQNRRMGISPSGIMDSYHKHGKEKTLEWLRKGYEYVKKMDVEYSANWLHIPASRKLTTVKPEGTTSLLAGVSPGIHYPHDKYYIRRIRISKNSPLCEVLEDHGYRYELERDTKVFEFPMMSENFIKSKKDATVEDQFRNAVDLQRDWSDNAVSITVTFKHRISRDSAENPLDLQGNIVNEYNPVNPKIKESNMSEVLDCLFKYDKYLKCISLLPDDPFAYPLMPYESITKEKFDEMWKTIAPINFREINLYQAPETEDKFCSSDGCAIKNENDSALGANIEKASEKTTQLN
jgi:hypothetical protein